MLFPGQSPTQLKRTGKDTPFLSWNSRVLFPIIYWIISLEAKMVGLQRRLLLMFLLLGASACPLFHSSAHSQILAIALLEWRPFWSVPHFWSTHLVHCPILSRIIGTKFWQRRVTTLVFEVPFHLPFCFHELEGFSWTFQGFHNGGFFPIRSSHQNGMGSRLCPGVGVGGINPFPPQSSGFPLLKAATCLGRKASSS